MAPPTPNAGREFPGFPWLLWDILRAGRGRPEDTVLRQQARLRRLIEYARSRSPYYRERYAALSRGAHDLPALPPVAKSDLMANFDGWATDPAVTRETAEAFVADPTRIGHYYLDQYVAFSTSGTTGTPAVFLHDRGAISVYQGLLLARRLPTLIAAGAFGPFFRNRARTATIITTGGHFASSVVEALVRSRHPRLAGRASTRRVERCASSSSNRAANDSCLLAAKIRWGRPEDFYIKISVDRSRGLVRDRERGDDA